MYYTYYYHKQITKWHKKNHTEEKFHKKSFDNLMTKKRYCNAWNDIKKSSIPLFLRVCFPNKKKCVTLTWAWFWFQWNIFFLFFVEILENIYSIWLFCQNIWICLTILAFNFDYCLGLGRFHVLKTLADSNFQIIS